MPDPLPLPDAAPTPPETPHPLLPPAAALPLDHLLLETDAPYQPLRGRKFSRWADLGEILRGLAGLRREAGAPGGFPGELEAATDRNFRRVFFGE
ncbi:hypothetical protein AGMMS4952_09960 [Spirochaetia bacterium]|nr:hypothetical protein AGMMS4952_09960 [Spirochaetia bacterium]